ncbi:MAG TPA: hypothetical protein VLX32_00360 [Candidatus Acidoferrum sp.]|nr:hypothetical protein [Candidatus Acidoferrum sp.]
MAREKCDGHAFARGICIVLGAACAWVYGCGGGSAGSVAPPPPPPPAITVSVTPTASSVLLGNSLTFSASVSNTTNTGVSWSVNGVAGGTAATGTITASGVFTAPADLPSPQTVQVTATSVANATKSASAQVTVSSDIGISLTPGSSAVELGAAVAFQAQITSSGHPDNSVRWSLSGSSCPSGCGTLDAGGNYTAPQVLPASTSVTLTAQSAADVTKKATAAIQITSNFTLQISSPSSVSAGGTATIVATLVPVPGSNPSPTVSWSLSGAGCNGNTCGVLTTTTQASGSGAIPDTATYTAPATVPNPNTVTVTITPQADPPKEVQATLAIQSGPGVSLTPVTATLAANHRITLTTQVSGLSDTGIAWGVNGVAGGNASLGQICVVASSPCQAVTSGTALQVDYLAPGGIPSPNPVSVTATSVANSSLSASAQVTVINHIVVSVQPASATLAPGAVQGFTASVLGTSNQNVVWQVQGTGCVASGACGSVDASGIYTAASVAPSPNALQIVATSSDDPSQSGSANVTITAGADIQSLEPASIYAGGANGFTLRVDGSGFVASSPGPGSTLLIAGSARTTTCTTAGECTAPVFAADVAVAGKVSVQMQNPDGSESSAVSLVVASPNNSDGTVQLTSGTPEVDGVNITVVDPTTAGLSVPGSSVDLNVGALGTFSIATNTCNLTGNPVPIVPPATGTSAVDVCVLSQSGLDTSMTYTVSGPGDISIVAKQPAGLGIIHLTLQVAAGAEAGARTLFIQNTNLDKTAASGALEVQ